MERATDGFSGAEIEGPDVVRDGVLAALGGAAAPSALEALVSGA